MNRIEAHLHKFMPLFVVLGIVNAMLCALQGISGSFNPYLSVFFFILNLIGARLVWCIWQRNRQQQRNDSLPSHSNVQ